MLSCRDEKIAYLRKFGYNVISLPRIGVRPLTVAFLHERRRLTELGYLPEIWSSTESVPTPMTGEDVAKLSGQSTSKLNGEVGLDVLANLVQALGADPIGIKAQFGKAKSFEFHFKEVERERITAFALGGYLTSGKLASDDPFVRRYFQPTERVYVVTEVLKSNGFGVTANDASNNGLAVDVPVIQRAMSGKASIQVESSSQGTVEFVGATKVPFAFIAAQLAWEGDRCEVIDFPDPGEIHLAVSDPPPVRNGEFAQPWKGGSVLFGDGLVELEEPPADI